MLFLCLKGYDPVFTVCSLSLPLTYFYAQDPRAKPQLSLLLCLLLLWVCPLEAHEHKNAVTRDMMSQPNLSVTTQFRDFVHPPFKAEFSQ